MRKVVLTVLFIVSGITMTAAANAPKGELDKWEFYSVIAPPDMSELESIPDNGVFSKESVYLMRQLKTITYRTEQAVPGDPAQRVVIEKGDVYKALCTIEKGLKKDVKSNLVNADESVRLFDRAVKVGMAAFYADDSSSFEAALRQNRKDYKKLLDIFESVSLK